MQINWNEVVENLINHLIAADCVIVRAVDGEHQVVTDGVSELAECVCCCDEGLLVVSYRGFQFTLYIVLGNAPFETVSDYSRAKTVPTDIVDSFDNVLDRWSNAMEAAYE